MCYCAIPVGLAYSRRSEARYWLPWKWIRAFVVGHNVIEAPRDALQSVLTCSYHVHEPARNWKRSYRDRNHFRFRVCLFSNFRVVCVFLLPLIAAAAASFPPTPLTWCVCVCVCVCVRLSVCFCFVMCFHKTLSVFTIRMRNKRIQDSQTATFC